MDEYEKNVAKAKKRVARLDKLDGFKDRALGTIVSALEAGLKRPETGAQYDALVMLEEIYRKERAFNCSG